MKIMLVGEYAWPWYQEACARALEYSGCQVIRFGWFERFKKWLPGKGEPVFLSFDRRMQYRFLLGPQILGINQDLKKVALREKPDVIWFYNVQLVYPQTVSSLRELLPKTIFCQYTNDNPFATEVPRSIWRHFINSIPLFDLHFAYRKDNIPDFKRSGAKDVFLLRSYFIPEIDQYIPREEIEDKYICDVVFSGHYENDGRIEALEAICKAGFKLKLYGGGWHAAKARLSPDSPLRVHYPIEHVMGLDYNKAICGAKVALCFLSTLNKDTYTRRSFQIPAMKVAMLSERSDDLEGLFEDRQEAVFFSDTGDLLEKLKWLCEDPLDNDRIAQGGLRRVYLDGHSVNDRMKEFLGIIGKYSSSKCL